MHQWKLSEPQELTFDEVSTLRVRLIAGNVSVVGTDDVPTLEVADLHGEPLRVTHTEDGELTVSYEDLSWRGLLSWFGPKSRASVTLAVPRGCTVELGVISAGAILSNLHGKVSVRGVSGDITLVGLTGTVDAQTIAGGLDAQAVAGDLTINTISGAVTIVDGSDAGVRATTVSGALMLDLGVFSDAEIRLSSVSGDLAIRLPHLPDARVDLYTTGGDVISAFDALHDAGFTGARHLTGTLGRGTGLVTGRTISGTVSVLRRDPLPGSRQARPAGGDAEDTTRKAAR
jgi:hypothetical protein